MDIRYKSFVPRSKQDHRFDQLLHTTSSINKTNYNHGSSTSTDLPSNNFSTHRFPTNNQLLLSSQNRKKVNVVTFKPDEHNELVAKSNNTQNQFPANSPKDQSQPSIANYDISKLNNTNIPSILRTSRLPSGPISINNSIESSYNGTSSSIVDSASKLIAAKRKAARESNINNKLLTGTGSNVDDSKRKYNPSSSSSSSYVPDSSVKRAVSPEILRPDPPLRVSYNDHINNGQPSTKTGTLLDNMYNDKKNSGNTSHKQQQSNELINVNTGSNRSQENSANNSKNVAVKLKPPIINVKRNKVSYNARPWQNQLDDEFDNQYKLKPENIIYQSNDSLEVAPDLDCFDYDYEDQDYPSLSDDIDTKLGKSKDFAEKSYFNDGLYNIVKQYPTSTTNGASTRKIDNREKFTILKNVKEAHECQETGETQDLLDDVEYLIEGLKCNLQSSTRTLSIITLTSKCLSRSFKELLKAHGLVGKIFQYLDDAHKDESVAMCTAALFLVFARDKQPRLFDDESLELLLKLPQISKNQTKFSKENERIRDKIRLVLDKLHHSANDTFKIREKEGKSQNVTSSSFVFQRSCVCCRHLKLNSNITTEDLVVECLLQLSSRKCVDWFKNQMRKLRGLDLICEQVTASIDYLGEDLGPQNLDEFVMDRLYRLFNYMRFLENMTFQNRDNQSYLIDYNDTILINHFWRCLKLCSANLSYQMQGSQEKTLIQACLLAILGLLANISHDNEWTSNQLGNCTGLLKLIFSCLLHLPRFMSSGKRFDLSVLALALLINLAEHCSENRLRMGHVSISRKRVACLGKSGQILEDLDECVNVKQTKSMGFSFDDEIDEEDMDLEDDDENEDSGSMLNIDCESSDIKINVLEALVKLFLRHDDRAKNNVLIEGEAEVGNNDEIDESGNDPKWRLVADKSLMRRNKTSKINKEKNIYGMEFSESEDDASSDEGADVEFLINSKEEEEELQKKLSAAGQHMQDSVVSAYTALLLGCLIKGSGRFMERIRKHLPSGKFRLLAFVLAKFVSILSLTSGMGKSGEESILEIVRLLEAQDLINSNNNSNNFLSSSTGDDERLLSSKPLYRNHCHSSESPTSSSVDYSSKFNLSTSTDEENHNEVSFNDLVSIQ